MFEVGSDRPSRDELLRIYLAALDDYQFQVKITSTRTQFCLTLNAAIVAVAATLARVPNREPDFCVVAVLVAGLCVTIFSVLAIDAGRAYYAPVIDRIKRLESELGVAKFGLRTTPEQGGPKPRFKITPLLKGLFAAIGTIEIVGTVYIACIASV